MPTRTQEPPGFPAEIPTPSTLRALHQVMVRCTRCELFLSRTQVVPGAGDADAEVLFVGAAGRLLDSMLEAGGLPRDRVFIANVVRCRPPANRNPRAREIRACAGWLAEQIRLVDPRLVVTLGRFALQHFVPEGRITRLQGTPQQVDYAGRSLRVLPLLHPSSVLRNPDLRPSYEAQFREVGRMLGEQ